MQNAIIAHDPEGEFDVDALKAEAASLPDLEGLDLAKAVSTPTTYEWTETTWEWNEASAHRTNLHITWLRWTLA